MNKTNMKKINSYDHKRIEMLANFIGALSIKAKEFFMILSTMVGLVQGIEEPVNSLAQIDATPGHSDYANTSLPMELIMGVLSSQDITSMVK
jgi:hypothetical protein